MRQHRHRSLIRHLLPDHHVYVRSGSSSRYVVLAWPWPVGVAAALVSLVLWAGVASYGWVTAKLEVREQRREVARLQAVNQQLEAMAGTVSGPRQTSAAPAATARLVVDLEEIKAGHRLALRLAEADEADPTMLDTMLDSATVAADVRQGGAADAWLAARLLPAALHAGDSGRGRDWLYDRLTRPLVDGQDGAAEMVRLRSELRAARAEVARLKSAPSEAGETLSLR